MSSGQQYLHEYIKLHAIVHIHYTLQLTLYKEIQVVQWREVLEKSHDG